MKLFKTVDEKLAEIGFTKVEEDKYGCEYERKDKKYGYTQIVYILHKKSGRHILQSYDPDLGDSKRNRKYLCWSYRVWNEIVYQKDETIKDVFR